jgi:CelD/BcsL family acetyltransferase involved in cellulose biosynthesis
MATLRSSLDVTLMSDVAALELLRGEWEQLIGRSAGQRPSLTPTWTLAWWSVFGGDGRRLHALALRDAGTLVGLVPLLQRRHWYRQFVPMRRLELVASGEERRDEILSEYLGPIAAVGYEERVVEALAARLAEDRTGWEEIVMSSLDGQAPAARLLASAFTARGFACESRVTAECPFIRLPARWDDYLASLSSEHRYLVRRSMRDFDRWAGKDWKVEIARTHEELGRGKEILHQLHQRRWEAAGRDGVFVSPAFRRFHDRVMPALLDRGELDLRWLTVGGEPVAAAYSVIHDNRVYYYQGGRSLAVPKGVRPGIVLHLHAIRAAVEAGRAEYDFLGGDARYKIQLSTETRPLVELRVTRPSLAEAARLTMEMSRDMILRTRAGSSLKQRIASFRSEP